MVFLIRTRKTIITSSVSILTAFFATLTIALFFTFTLISTSVSATTSTLTLNVVDSIDLDITPSASGSFAKSGEEANSISVTTNNGTGYTLGIKASVEGNNALNATSGATIPSITTSISESDFTSSPSYNDQWGYKPSRLNSVANTNYLQAPTSSSTATVLDQTTTANVSTANTYNITIGAKLTNATLSGSYSNSFIVTAVANPAVYSITYDANGGSDAPPNVSNATTFSETVNISSIIPTRNGFNFMGWCTNMVADNATCSGTTYVQGATWTLDHTIAANSLTLYAIWSTEDPCSGKTALYDLVACRSKSTQTVAELRTAIESPTETDTVSSNSGVYEYNSEVFGTPSDASNDHTIYYYRGVLDSYGHTGTYGSDGLSDAYPNYVKLGSDSNATCWRIIRTTGSGGVKMIFNGFYGATTGNSCANSIEQAQTDTSKAYGGTASGVYNNIVGVGYTRNSTYATTSATTPIVYNTLFGNNFSYSGNNTAANTKAYIEDTWFSNISSFTSKLETSAGWCNDRTLYSATSGADAKTPIDESTQIVPYGTSDMVSYYFGPYIRNRTKAQAPSLKCARNTVDLYTTSSASHGNRQLTKPIAMITIDEAAFAGSGYSASTTPYNNNSYMYSGRRFWSMSPSYRDADGRSYAFRLNDSNGSFGSTHVGYTYGIRPSISLKAGTIISGGSGIATDPWVITP